MYFLAVGREACVKICAQKLVQRKSEPRFSAVLFFVFIQRFICRVKLLMLKRRAVFVFVLVLFKSCADLIAQFLRIKPVCHLKRGVGKTRIFKYLVYSVRVKRVLCRNDKIFAVGNMLFCIGAENLGLFVCKRAGNKHIFL